MTKKSVVFTIDGQDGIFKFDKSVTMYWENITQKSFKEIIAAVIKESRKYCKREQVCLDILSMEYGSYKRESKYRFIIHAGWSGIELDVRRFNGYDFSDSKVFTFATENDLFKYLKTQVTDISNGILEGDIPEDATYYGRYISDKGLFEEERPELFELLQNR